MSKKVSHNFSLSYSSRDSDNGDTELDVSISFENPKTHKEIADKIASWLVAINQAETIGEFQK